MGNYDIKKFSSIDSNDIELVVDYSFASDSELLLLVSNHLDGELYLTTTNWVKDDDAQVYRATFANPFTRKYAWSVFVIRRSKVYSELELSVDGNGDLTTESICNQFKDIYKRFDEVQIKLDKAIVGVDIDSELKGVGSQYLPEAEFRANKFLSFDAYGNPVATIPTDFFDEIILEKLVSYAFIRQARNVLAEARAVANEITNKQIKDVIGVEANCKEHENKAFVSEGNAERSAEEAKVYMENASLFSADAEKSRAESRTSEINASISEQNAKSHVFLADSLLERTKALVEEQKTQLEHYKREIEALISGSKYQELVDEIASLKKQITSLQNSIPSDIKERLQACKEHIETPHCEGGHGGGALPEGVALTTINYVDCTGYEQFADVLAYGGTTQGGQVFEMRQLNVCENNTTTTHNFLVEP